MCLLVLLLVPLSQVQALSLDEVVLQELSSTEQSLIIDCGEMENYKTGDIAHFFVQRGSKEYPKVFLVAEGELIKTFPRKSYWIMRKIHIPKSLVTGSKLLVLSSKSVSPGRSLKIKTRHRVLNADEFNTVDDFLAQNNENVPSRLFREEKNYLSGDELFESDKLPEADVEVSTYEGFRNKSQTYYSEEYGDLTQQRYFIGNREVPLGDIKVDEDKKLFESMSQGYQNQIGNLEYGVKDFYRHQEKLPDMKELNKAITMKSTYDRTKEDAKLKAEISPRAIAKIERDGQQWSEDMDSTSLRRYFIQTGMESEVRRRELALNELDGHEIMLHYSGSMVDHSTADDPNYRGRGYHLGLGYDLHLSRSSIDLKNWSLQFILERGVVDTNLGELNGRSEEGFYGAYLNYYFVNNPLTLNSFIYLAGVGIKVGSSTVSAPDLNKEYSFQVLTLPSLQLMTKYRFRAGDLSEDTVNVGASANFGINLDLKKYNAVDTIEDEIDSKFSHTDLKYYVGMSVYF